MATKTITLNVPKRKGMLDIEEQIAQAMEQAKKQALSQLKDIENKSG